MASIVPRGLVYILYFDNWFCGVDLQVVLKKVGVSSVGTVREARLKGCKLPSDKDLKKKGRGSYMEIATTFEGVSLRAVKWFDNRPVTLLSPFAAASPEQAVKRFHKTRTTTRETFLAYFDNGMSPAKARLHESKLLVQEDGYALVANSAVNPLPPAIYYWHRLWR
ncbi:hypothetical protein HPB51_025608 [Rhipicephalus microplus]|uniref:PiggyBac transposable element-derived protein domain-containing protein n=1 Tax=Rhipicephalus microplus TaxID=6941 RepID=A0A9J6D7S6_RHIMP|nr:hypothetical protein HPB51_025608 [Rhipicephalus microplus]